MYKKLFDFSQRPAPFSRHTVKELWTRPHLAKQMLSYHLNQDTDLASRKFETIEKGVSWIDSELNLSGKRLCDLGCGPGLYTERFAEKGALVTGVDFSAHSVDYAKKHSQHNINYLCADYLEDSLPLGFDVVTLIYWDLCVLSAIQRQQLLASTNEMLNPGGHIVVDLLTESAFATKTEQVFLEPNYMGGFWSANDYVGVQRTFVYPEELLTLDRYMIAEPNETWEIYNWLQYFTITGIRQEFEQAGFKIERLAGDLTGSHFSEGSEQIGIIASTGK